MGINFDDDSAEERKQQKYKFAINHEERMSEVSRTRPTITTLNDDDGN